MKSILRREILISARANCGAALFAEVFRRVGLSPDFGRQIERTAYFEATAAGCLRPLYTASTNISVVHEPVDFP